MYPETTHKHFSSTTLMMERMPFWFNLGVGTAAREPSPRNRVESSHFVSCAASLMVKGRTLMATEIEEAPSGVAIVNVYNADNECTNYESNIGNREILVTRRARQQCDSKSKLEC